MIAGKVDLDVSPGSVEPFAIGVSIPPPPPPPSMLRGQLVARPSIEKSVLGSSVRHRTACKGFPTLYATCEVPVRSPSLGPGRLPLSSIRYSRWRLVDGLATRERPEPSVEVE